MCDILKARRGGRNYELRPNQIQQGLNAKLYNETEGFASAGEKNAEKAMKAAEAAYQKELGIYKPTLLERIKAMFRSA